MSKILKTDNHVIPYIEKMPEKESKGTVVLIHGIFVDKNEEGSFTRLSENLSEEGFRTIRFDYSGHGEHKTKPEEMRFSSILLDTYRMIEYANNTTDKEIHIVASSFGAGIYLSYLKLNKSIKPDRIVMWNPAANFSKTFIEPEGKKLKEIFSKKKIDDLYENGVKNFHPTMDFPFSLEFMMELELYKPYEELNNLNAPTRIVHGNKDEELPHEMVKEQSKKSSSIEFHTINGAKHGFPEKESEKEAIQKTVEFFKD